MYYEGGRVTLDSIIETLERLALRSPHRRSRHATIITNKHGKVVSTGWNHDTTHSEEHALRRCGYKVPEGVIFWNIMLKRGGSQGTARPCPDCLRLLRAFRVKTVVYSREGVWVKEKL